jgi:S1-C subfamily serine protease
VGVDPATGIAVIQVDAHARALSPLPLGDSDAVSVGDPVVAIGNPLSSNPLSSTRTATAGIVSAFQRSADLSASVWAVEHAIETDAAINHGNSGGPLINSLGEVIGINSAATSDASSSGGAVGLGFAIPINSVKGVIAEIVHGAKIQHAFLGVSVLPLTGSVARIFDLPSSHGLLVQQVVNGSSANRAGLRAGTTVAVIGGESYRLGGDIIVALDGIPLVDEAQLGNLIEERTPGERVELVIWRAGHERSVAVTLGAPPG